MVGWWSCMAKADCTSYFTGKVLRYQSIRKNRKTFHLEQFAIYSSYINHLLQYFKIFPIVLNAFSAPLCLKLCWHNRLVPSFQSYLCFNPSKCDHISLRINRATAYHLNEQLIPKLKSHHDLGAILFDGEITIPTFCL